MIKTIIFDLGKVIVDYDHSKIIRRIAERSNYGEDEIKERIFSTSLVYGYDTGKISSQEFFEEVKREFDVRMDFEEFTDVWTCTFDLKPILSEEFIESLSKKYRLIVLSDTNELHFEFIEKNFPIMRFFDDYVLSYKCGFAKPQSEIFRIAIEKAECKAEECLFTDDREVNIQSAADTGINAFVFTSPEKFKKDIAEILNADSN